MNENLNQGIAEGLRMAAEIVRSNKQTTKGGDVKKILAKAEEMEKGDE